MRILNQEIKRFAFSDALVVVGSLPAAEERMRSCCRWDGRPSGSSRIENSNSGGHKRNENMKRNEESSSVELLVERRTNSMTSNALEVYSPCGKNIPLPISIEVLRKNIKTIVSLDEIYSHLQEVA